jgi:hypothetical protein
MKKSIVTCLFVFCFSISPALSETSEPSTEDVQAATIQFITGLGLVDKGKYDFPMKVIPRQIPAKAKQMVTVDKVVYSKAQAYLASVYSRIKVSDSKVKNTELLLILVDTPDGWVLAGGKDMNALRASEKEKEKEKEK